MSDPPPTFQPTPLQVKQNVDAIFGKPVRWDWIRLVLCLVLAAGFTAGLIVVAVSDVLIKGLWLIMLAVPAAFLYGDAARIFLEIYEKDQKEKELAEATAKGAAEKATPEVRVPFLPVPPKPPPEPKPPIAGDA